MAKAHADYLGLEFEYHNCGNTPLTRALQPALEQ